ncbi:MAG: response regulator [Desulfobulbaceae bacterium]|nr:response regulator [Desulfobulbaceae bacterium]MCK5339872.1 response regulator [Desulfobulbaceae bacterium]
MTINRSSPMKEMKVLLVDDEETFVKTLSERLEMRDMKSDTVFGGQEALHFVDDNEPDVMVLDLKMPGIDGMEVLRRIKKRYPRIQVIILTGHGTDKDEDEARRLGIFDYMQKPADIETLAERIKAAYKTKVQDVMAAVAFAEAGEAETAINMVTTKKEKESE